MINQTPKKVIIASPLFKSKFKKNSPNYKRPPFLSQSYSGGIIPLLNKELLLHHEFKTEDMIKRSLILNEKEIKQNIKKTRKLSEISQQFLFNRKSQIIDLGLKSGQEWAKNQVFSKSEDQIFIPEIERPLSPATLDALKDLSERNQEEEEI